MPFVFVLVGGVELYEVKMLQRGDGFEDGLFLLEL
jgi:hypothetical protein